MKNNQHMARSRSLSARSGGRRRACQSTLAAVALPVLALLGLSLGAAPASADTPTAAVAAASVPADALVPAPTTLMAAPISVVRTVTTIRMTYSARLTVTATGKPIAGQFVLFRQVSLLPSQSPLRNLVCEPVTDVNGVASCSITLLNIVNVLERPAYTAVFFGTEQYAPAVAAGTLSLA